MEQNQQAINLTNLFGRFSLLIIYFFTKRILMTEYINKYVIIVFLVLFSSCKKRELSLNPVSYAHFEKFINETNYITDAEKYGWSIVQLDVYNFKNAQRYLEKTRRN